MPAAVSRIEGPTGDHQSPTLEVCADPAESAEAKDADPRSAAFLGSSSRSPVRPVGAVARSRRCRRSLQGRRIRSSPPECAGRRGGRSAGGAAAADRRAGGRPRRERTKDQLEVGATASRPAREPDQRIVDSAGRDCGPTPGGRARRGSAGAGPASAMPSRRVE